MEKGKGHGNEVAGTIIAIITLVFTKSPITQTLAQ